MRWFGRMLLIVLLGIVVGGCSSPTGPSTGGGGGGGDPDGGSGITGPLYRTFRAQTISGAWYDVPSTRLGTGNRVDVYVEDGSEVTEATAEAIADDFDANVYGMIRANFTTETDVDENGKIILLLLDIQDGFSGSGGYVAGYYDSTHVQAGSNSNGSEMLFMDIYPGVAGSETFNSTMAHEMQHLVNDAHSIRTGVYQDLWINEGLSAGAEYLYAGEQIQSRIDQYRFDADGSVRYGNNFFVWNGAWEQSGYHLANYSTVYLFFQWLRIHASNDTAIYADILDSSFGDYRAVTEAASGRIDPSFADWETLFSNWLHANLLHRPTGFKGYKSEIDLDAPPWLDDTINDWPFSPGEAAYFSHGAAGYIPPDGSGANIRYHGVRTVDFTIDTTGPEYRGDFTIVFNADSTISGADQTAYLPAIDVVETRALSSSYAESERPQIYPIGHHPARDTATTGDASPKPLDAGRE